jgi:predicted nucleic acid-binding protein
MKLIDANVLFYAAGSPHPYRDASTETMRRIQRGEIEAAISTEILQEVLHYYRRQHRAGDGIRMFDDLIRQFPSPLPIIADTMRGARDILAGYPLLNARDAVHAAVVFEHRLEGIISADRAFDGIAGLTRFDPKELAV